MGVISIILDIMSLKKRLFAVFAYFRLTPRTGRGGETGLDHFRGRRYNHQA